MTMLLKQAPTAVRTKLQPVGVNRVSCHGENSEFPVSCLPNKASRSRAVYNSTAEDRDWEEFMGQLELTLDPKIFLIDIFRDNCIFISSCKK